MSSFINFTPEERLVKARVKLQKEKPFWSYLTMNLTFVETKDLPTAGVDAYGNLYFNPEYIDTLSDEEIKGVLAHEVMHCALEHLDRGKGKQPDLCNISQDAVINAIILKDGFQLPKGVILPTNNSIDLFGIRFKKLTEKTSEEVYDKLWRKLGKEYKRAMKQIEDAIKKEGLKGFDEHIYSDGKGKKNKEKKCEACGGTGKTSDGKDCERCNGKGKIKRKNIDWKKKLVDACSHARQQGHLPAGMERIVGKLLETYIDWRGLLYKYITSQIPVDYNWGRPSKKSHSLGIYLPAVEKETIDVMAWVDTSGSISHKELSEFISEISSICRSFKNVELTVGDCDCKVNGIYNLKNANPYEVVDKIGKNLKGGGGTSHIPVFNWIKKHKPNAKFVICFTDLWTDFPPVNTVKQPVLWVVAGNWRNDVNKVPFGKVISLPKNSDDD